MEQSCLNLVCFLNINTHFAMTTKLVTLKDIKNQKSKVLIILLTLPVKII